MSRHRHERFREGYAVVRVDEFLAPEVPKEHLLYVKEIWRTQDLAEAEVDRLNALNAEKGCRYFWQYTRVEHDA